jgi:ribosomal protein L11 methyltransferase
VSVKKGAPPPRLYRGVEVLGEAADEEVVARIASEIESPGVELREDEGEGVRYRVYFPDGLPLHTALRLQTLWREYAGREPAALRPFAERESDWVAATREAFTGTEVGPFWIGPPWLEPPPRCRAIRINPGRAFGTGLHPTTRLVLRLLLLRVTSGTRVLDLGTGSGILALAALALGAGRVTALDLDSHALLNARENAALNSFSGAIRFVAGSLDALAPGGHAFDLVLANIEYATLLPLLPRLVSALAPEGQLAVSGITLGQRPGFLDAARAEGLASWGEVEEDGWWGAVLAAG